jgi:hypothetical protein
MALVEIKTLHEALCGVADEQGKVDCVCDNGTEKHNLCRVSKVVISFHDMHSYLRSYDKQQNTSALNYVARQAAKKIFLADWESFQDNAERKHHFLHHFRQQLFLFHLYVTKYFSLSIFLRADFLIFFFDVRNILVSSRMPGLGFTIL